MPRPLTQRVVLLVAETEAISLVDRAVAVAAALVTTAAAAVKEERATAAVVAVVVVPATPREHQPRPHRAAERPQQIREMLTTAEARATARQAAPGPGVQATRAAWLLHGREWLT